MDILKQIITNKKRTYDLEFIVRYTWNRKNYTVLLYEHNINTHLDIIY